MYRYTATEKWDDPWYRKLKPAEKLIFEYLRDRCDNAGFYEIDYETMSYYTLIPASEIEGACKGLDKGLLWGMQGAWVYLVNFLKHQKNTPLNPNNPAHKQILNLFEAKKKYFDLKKMRGACEGLGSPLGIVLSDKGIGIPSSTEGGTGEKSATLTFSVDQLEQFLNESGRKKEEICMAFSITPQQLGKYQLEFLTKERTKETCWHNRKDALGHFINWLTKDKLKTTKTLTEQWLA